MVVHRNLGSDVEMFAEFVLYTGVQWPTVSYTFVKFEPMAANGFEMSCRWSLSASRPSDIHRMSSEK